MDNKNFLNALVLAHCITQSEMYSDALMKYENGYQPKTPIWEMITAAECHGIEPVAYIIASVITGAKFKKLTEPSSALCDLMMALKYKTKFFNPKEHPGNTAVKILNEVYNNSIDLLNTALSNGDIPSDVADEVCDTIYNYE